MNIDILNTNVSGDRGHKFLKAIDLAEKILSSDTFKKWFLERKFTQLGELESKDQELLLARATKDVAIIYFLKRKPWYNPRTSAIGATSGNTISTYFGPFDYMAVYELAGHIAHEVMHVQGFSHSFNYSQERDGSVPYMVGSYVEKKAREMST